MGERSQVPFFKNVLLGGFNIDSFGIVDRGMRVANPDDFDAAFQRKRQSRDRSDIAKALDNGRAFLRVYFQHVHGAFNQVNHAAASGFAPAFGATDGDRFAGDNFTHCVPLIN